MNRSDIFTFIKEQYDELGQAGFWAWYHEQDPASQAVVQEVLADPAFGLQPHQQMPDGAWRFWFLRMGRGAGKTFAASCAVHVLARDIFPAGNGILVGATVKDVRDTMILGDSGLIATAPPDFAPNYNKHDNILTWPNGSTAIIRTADNPEDIRGPTLNWGWADEVVKWRSEASWDNLKRCVRNKHVNGTRLIVTSTPKRAKQWIKEIENEPGCIVSTGSTLDNEHLDDTFLDAASNDTSSARGREEVLGDWVEGDGELWTEESLDACRQSPSVSLHVMAASMDRRILSVDPSSGKGKDETGIILLGMKGGKAYVLHDFTSGGNIDQWTSEVVHLAKSYLKPGDKVVMETNINAAAVNVLTMKDKSLRIVEVHQKYSKWKRAEEAFSYFEAGQVVIWHTHPKLEQQLKEWEPEQKKSPDRGDAMTQGIIHLLGKENRPGMRVPVFSVGGFSA